MPVLITPTRLPCHLYARIETFTVAGKQVCGSRCMISYKSITHIDIGFSFVISILVWLSGKPLVTCYAETMKTILQTISLLLLSFPLLAAEEEKEDHFSRELVIQSLELPNSLRVTGSEFSTKSNPVGEGVIVYNKRTRFPGVERFLIWLVINETAFPLNGPSKSLTPKFMWRREADSTAWSRTGLPPNATKGIIDWTFKGKEITPTPAASAPKQKSSTETFTVKEYRIYRALINTPMSVSESEAIKLIAKEYGVSQLEVNQTARKVMQILHKNGWAGSPSNEIKYALDWNSTK